MVSNISGQHRFFLAEQVLISTSGPFVHLQERDLRPGNDHLLTLSASRYKQSLNFLHPAHQNAQH